MIFIKREDEIEKMKKAGVILADVHKNLKNIIKPGILSSDIDDFVEQFLKERGATPEQKGYHGYPYATCVSVNDVICHGFPSKKKLEEGDIVTVDMVVNLDGWLADSAWSYTLGEVSDEAKKLLAVTYEALYRGIDQAIIGNRLGDIGHAIQTYVEAEGFSVVRDFVGHGIGKVIHEDPQVPHYGTAGRGTRLTEGMVLTIEPMVNVGTWEMKIDEDGWTARTRDGKLSAQYEHTLVITKNGPYITTYQGERNDNKYNVK